MTDNITDIKDTDFIDIYENRGFGISSEQDTRISIEKEKNITRCFYMYEENELQEQDLRDIKFRQIDDNGRKKSLLIEINNDEKNTVIYPICTWVGNTDFLTFKYKNIKCIEFRGFSTDIISAETGFYLLHGIPQVFIKTLTDGLGFRKEYRFIVDTIKDKIPECEKIVISKNEKTQLFQNTIIISEEDLDVLRRGCDRIVDNARKNAIEDRQYFVYNELLHRKFPEFFSEIKKKLKKDIIYKTIRDYDFDNTKLSNRDKNSLLNIKDNIDASYLRTLINEFKSLIDKESGEASFQKFFNENPLLLTTISGAPYIRIKDQAYVGGKSFNNQEGEYADFLLKNKATNNSFIIEIKKPNTKLLEKNQYRVGVYSPTKELTGAIAQIITQKYNLETQIANLVHNADDKNVEAYNIQGMIIAGTLSSIENTKDAKCKKRSFELFRNGQKNIKIITYDECLHILNVFLELITKCKKNENNDNESL